MPENLQFWAVRLLLIPMMAVAVWIQTRPEQEQLTDYIFWTVGSIAIVTAVQLLLPAPRRRALLMLSSLVQLFRGR
jgi:hypothetical protein